MDDNEIDFRSGGWISTLFLRNIAPNMPESIIIMRTSIRNTQKQSFKMPFMSLTFQESNTNAYTYMSPPKTTFNH